MVACSSWQLSSINKLSPERLKELRERYWSQRLKEIEEALSAVEQPQDLIRDALQVLAKPQSNDEERVRALEELEELVQRLDVAYDFRTVRPCGPCVWYTGSVS